jgi:DNA-binding transcriptional LysR family regulator
MMQPNLDMDALRTLIATQKLGSLNRAAERIGRSQSAVSQQMRKLEAQVGMPLFRRKGRGLALTDAGEKIVSYAHRILDLNDEAVRSVRAASVEGVVRFGLPGDFAETWLPAALGQFKRTHPGVRVEVAVERNGALLERLDRGELDMVLAMGYETRADAEPVATLPMTWIGPAHAHGATRPGESGEPLDLALYNAPCFFRRAGLAALDKAGISWRVAYTTASIQSLWSGVAAGLGITLRTAAGLPSTLKPLGERDGLPALPDVTLCLHTAHQEMPPALAHLKQTIGQGVLAHLPG